LSYTWLRRGLHNGDSRSLRAFLKLAVTPPRRCPGAVPPLPLPVGGAGCGRTLRARQVPPLLQQGNHSSNAHVKGLPVGVQDKVRVFRGLIGVTDAGKVGKLADQGLLVKPFTSRSISVARGAVTYTSRKSPISCLARARMERYGEMNDARQMTPWRVKSLATKATRSMFCSRSSREKPRSRVRLWRTKSPSSRSTGTPRARRAASTARAMVVFPAPDRPVNQTVTPRGSIHVTPPKASR